MSHSGPASRPPVNHPDHPLSQLEQARAAGIGWDQLAGSVPSRPADPGQHEQARSYLGFRAGLDPEHDQVTATRGAVILRPPPGAGLTERVWGLKPGDDLDFGDLAEVLDQVAELIHRPGELPGGPGAGRHVAPRPAP